MIAAHVLQLFFKEKRLKCVIIMEIIVQEHKLHVLLIFSNTIFILCSSLKINQVQFTF